MSHRVRAMRWLTSASAVLSFLTPLQAPRAQQQPCGTSESVQTQLVPARFYPHRPGGPFGASLRFRDAEFMWDSLYATGLTASIRSTLNRFAIALVETTGTSPVAADAHNTQAVYDYLNREGRFWSTNPIDQLNGLRLGDRTYGALDHSHVDAYITDWAHDKAGAYPAAWQTDDEDSTSGHPRGDVLHKNSVHFGGPVRSQPYDTTGTGWAAPGKVAFKGFNHEMAHGFLNNNFNTVVGGGMAGELWSAGAEVVGGIDYVDSGGEVPYTWSLTAWCDPSPPGCQLPRPLEDPAFDNRFSLSNYQGRTSFMAYVAYNFLNADTARTLAGMRDDLMYKWLRNALGDPSISALANVLTDAECPTCAQKTYFHPPGAFLNGVDRLALLHHNWRVASFVNNPGLAEGQFGYPAWGRFSPAVNLRAWQAFDGSTKTDIVALPAIVNLAPTLTIRDTSFIGSRSFRGMTHPLALAPYSANYWVIRPTGSLQGGDRSLVVRIIPRSCYLRCGGSRLTNGVRLMASAVAYDRADLAGEESNLWQTPNDAVYSTPVSWTVGDSTAGELKLVIPSFGLTHRAVLVVISAADSRSSDWVGAHLTDGYTEAVGYRMDVGVTPASPDLEPRRLSSNSSGPADWMAWAPTSDEVAYSDYDPSVSPNSQIYRRKIDGSPATRISAQSVNQLHPDWSPRGDHIVWATFPGSGQMDLWVADLSAPGNPAAQLTSQPGVSTLPAFQPNGQGIAYIREPATGNTGWELRWVGVDGTGDRLIRHFPYPTPGTPPLLPIAPRWTRSGSHLVVCDYTTRSFLRVPAGGGAPIAVPGNPLDFTSFDLAPGNGRLAATINTPAPNWGYYPADPFCSLHAAPAIVARRCVALLDTTAAGRDTALRFTEPGVTARNLRWSPDGTQIAYNRGAANLNDTEVWAGRVTLNRPPQLEGYAIEDQSIPACVPFILGPLHGSDPDGEPFTLEAAMLPPGAQFIGGDTFRWQYPELGEHFVVFRALDGSGGVHSKVVRISVWDAGNCYGEGLSEGGGGGSAFSAHQASTMVALSESADPTRPGNSLLDAPDLHAWSEQTARLTQAELSGESTVGATLVMGSGASVLLDRAEMTVVDHPAGSEANASANGVVVGSPVAPTSCVDSAGVALPLPASPNEAPIFCPQGGSLTATFAEGSALSAVVVECRRAYSVANGVRGGIRVMVRQSGGWADAGWLQPRRDWDALAAELPHGSVVKLQFEGDVYLRGVRGLKLLAEPMARVITTSELLAANDDSSLNALRSADSEAMRLEPGQTLRLAFATPPPLNAGTRSSFLRLRGRYEPANESLMALTLQTDNEARPNRLAFETPRPNPFARETTLGFTLPERARVLIEVFDPLGRRVRRLVNEEFGGGRHAIAWNGADADGRALAPGSYIARMTAGGTVFTRRLVLVSR